MKTQLRITIIILFSSISNLIGQDPISNLKTFGKAYGYVKYFHPSNEVLQIDWNEFGRYGAEKVVNCKNNKQLIDVLNSLYKPLGPGITFSKSDSKYDLKQITPDSIENYNSVYWQHLGVSFGMQYQYSQTNAYNSVRVNEREGVFPIFEDFPEFGGIIEREIGNGIYIQVPLNLYSNNKGSYPNSSNIEDLKNAIEVNRNDTFSQGSRLSNVIIIYNVIQHFYPYFDQVDVDWDKEFEKALKQSFSDQNENDHLITLQKLTATIKDGHMWISAPDNRHSYIVQIVWEWIENKLVITHVSDNEIKLNVGDVVNKINGVGADQYFKEVRSKLSSATEGHLNYIAQLTSRLGAKGAKLVLEVDNDTVTLIHDKLYNTEFRGIKIQQNEYQLLDSNIYYLNLNRIDMITFNELLPKLIQSKGIIFDLRGRPNGNHDIIAHLTKENINTKAWFKVPQIIYPDHNKIVGYEESGWDFIAKEPYLGNSRIVFITDGSALSYSESFMSIIKDQKLATIIGQPTGGTNGNINPFKIIGDYTVRWTGMKVINPDGSRFHGIGILPDIYVTKTIKGIKEGKDEFIDKAIEIIKK